MQGPAPFLSSINIALTCIVDSRKAAIIDGEHQILVNHEAYFVSDAGAKAKFLASPQTYCGLVTDPVTHERFQPSARTPRRDADGRVFLFASAETAGRYDADPTRYAVPVPMSMVPLDSGRTD